MEDPSPAKVSLTSLLCQETGTNYLGEEEELGGGAGDQEEEADSFVNTLMNCSGVSDSEEEEYIQMLLEREKKIVDGSIPFEKTTQTETSPMLVGNWTKTARLDSINYILNARAVFGFKFQTAYLAVIYLDRFLALRTLESQKSWAMKLLSVACLSLAAKLQECNVPLLPDFQVGEFNFEGKVIQRMELFVLNVLQWRIGSITPFDYLPFFINKLHNGHPSRAILTMILELIIAIMKDANLMDHYPSAIALSSVLISLDQSLSRKTLGSKIHPIPFSGLLDLEDITDCYIIMQRLERDRVKMPKLLASPDHSPINLSQNDIFHKSPPTSSICSKRKRLEFSDSDQGRGLADKWHCERET